MTDWREVKAKRLAGLTEDERAAFEREYQAAGVRLDLADALYQARTAAGLSQSELARRAGTTQAQISLIENAGRTPRVDTLRRIAEALGMSLVISFRPAA
ncbi:MAG: helix-turn-helix domain-containing protein [Propionibacteriaceae bacterium]|jgi:ribosome-binding protein aMBF1 (putative translation factor)|nr:helix-turn-helix domain-containing protein [Propionibacteriaceae bacterium]